MSKAKAPPAKLYAFSVTRSATFIVAARDEGEAYREADSWARDALANDDPRLDVDFEGEVDEDSWRLKEYGNDLAYGDYGLCQDRTVQQIFEDAQENPPPDESKGPVVLCDGCMRERVQWDWRKGRQLCAQCESEGGE